MMTVGIVVSEFNNDITDKLLHNALMRLNEKKVLPENIIIKKVPGAVEIPLIAQQLAKQKKQKNIEAIICLGAVVRGETGHYDAVCQQVSYGCQRIALDFDIPVIFEVLMTDTEELAYARLHKGADAVDVAFEMSALMKSC